MKFASLWRHQLNNISHLFILVQSFSVQRFLNVQKSLGGHKEICNFAVIEDNQMPLGIFMCV